MVVVHCVGFSLLRRNIQDLLHERSIEFGDETVRYGAKGFGPMFTDQIRNNPANQVNAYSRW